jgi:plastocyanin
VCLVAVPAAASALPGANVPLKKRIKAVNYAGVQHLHYSYGPINILPGQNNIELHPNFQKPKVPGYITRFKPNLVYSGTHKVPRVDVIHLHHGVWLLNGYPTFAAGEEKTTFQLPRGYGYHYDPSDRWGMNYMIHNLWPNTTKVNITYDIDFIPDSAPAAKSITPAHPRWMDVAGLSAYPVFNVYRGQGKHGKFTYPNQAKTADQKAAIGGARETTFGNDVTLLSTAGHLHPGGLYTDMKVSRGSATKEIFRSQAKYFEPAGAVSWDVSMTGTKPSWKVAVKKGDVVHISATYDSRDASWYEVMGIMVLWYADGIKPGAKDPFKSKIDWHGYLTHGHLAENNNHGGKPRPKVGDARKDANGVAADNIFIKGFVYGLGDFALPGRKGRPPTVKAGQSITFTNLDATPAIGPQESAYHTITACRAPCTGTTGIAYPIANANVQFDSGELGYGPPGFTPAANRNTWQTPKGLRTGTYTYFCRIHPFMRGSFRVVKN